MEQSVQVTVLSDRPFKENEMFNEYLREYGLGVLAAFLATLPGCLGG